MVQDFSHQQYVPQNLVSFDMSLFAGDVLFFLVGGIFFLGGGQFDELIFPTL